MFRALSELDLSVQKRFPKQPQQYCSYENFRCFIEAKSSLYGVNVNRAPLCIQRYIIVLVMNALNAKKTKFISSEKCRS